MSYIVPGGPGVGLQDPRGSRGRPTGSQGVNGATGDPGVGLQGPRGLRGRPTKSKEVKGYPTESQGVNV